MRVSFYVFFSNFPLWLLKIILTKENITKNWERSQFQKWLPVYRIWITEVKVTLSSETEYLLIYSLRSFSGSLSMVDNIWASKTHACIVLNHPFLISLPNNTVLSLSFPSQTAKIGRDEFWMGRHSRQRFNAILFQQKNFEMKIHRIWIRISNINETSLTFERNS